MSLPIVIDEIFGDDRLDHCHRERAIRARFWRDMPVGLLGGPRAIRVDDDPLCPSFAGFSNEWPMMQVSADGVAPQIMIYFEKARLSGSSALVGPTVRSHAVHELEAQ